MAITIIGSYCGIAAAKYMEDRVSHTADSFEDSSTTEKIAQSREENILRFVPLAILADIVFVIVLIELAGLVWYQVGGIPLIKEVAWIFVGICSIEVILFFGVINFHIIPTIARAMDNK